jgi:hypothetical protein
MLINVRRGMPKIHLAGYLGPVIYSDAPPPVERPGTPPGPDHPVWLDWTVVRMGDAGAVVLLNELGGSAAGGQNVYLRKICGRR